MGMTKDAAQRDVILDQICDSVKLPQTHYRMIICAGLLPATVHTVRFLIRAVSSALRQSSESLALGVPRLSAADG